MIICINILTISIEQIIKKKRKKVLLSIFVMFRFAWWNPSTLVCRYFSEIRLNNSQPLPSEFFVKVMLVENRLYTNAAGEQNLNERKRNNIVGILSSSAGSTESLCCSVPLCQSFIYIHKSNWGLSIMPLYKWTSHNRMDIFRACESKVIMQNSNYPPG